MIQSFVSHILAGLLLCLYFLTLHVSCVHSMLTCAIVKATRYTVSCSLHLSIMMSTDSYTYTLFVSVSVCIVLAV